MRITDGRVINVQHPWTPVSLDPEEMVFEKAQATTSMRRLLPGWEWGASSDLPRTKQAFTGLYIGHGGRVWVVRQGPGRVLNSGCEVEDPRSGDMLACWVEGLTLDVFTLDGAFLFTADLPPEIDSLAVSYLDKDDLLVRIEDDAGTLFVKQYSIKILEQGAGK